MKDRPKPEVESQMDTSTDDITDEDNATDTEVEKDDNAQRVFKVIFSRRG